MRRMTESTIRKQVGVVGVSERKTAAGMAVKTQRRHARALQGPRVFLQGMTQLARSCRRMRTKTFPERVIFSCKKLDSRYARFGLELKLVTAWREAQFRKINTRCGRGKGNNFAVSEQTERARALRQDSKRPGRNQGLILRRKKSRGLLEARSERHPGQCNGQKTHLSPPFV